MAALAANVAKLRAEVGWSTRAFADHTRMSTRTLYQIEHGNYRTISLETLRRLAQGFGIHPSHLVGALPRRRNPYPATPLRALVARNLIAARSQRSWTQAKFAEASGVDRAVIADIERGGRNASLAVLQRLAAAMEIRLADLLDGAAADAAQRRPPRAAA